MRKAKVGPVPNYAFVRPVMRGRGAGFGAARGRSTQLLGGRLATRDNCGQLAI